VYIAIIRDTRQEDLVVDGHAERVAGVGAFAD